MVGKEFAIQQCSLLALLNQYLQEGHKGLAGIYLVIKLSFVNYVIKAWLYTGNCIVLYCVVATGQVAQLMCPGD